jgi:hypothetical protein
MHDRPRYRSNAADCLSAAQDASQPNNRLLHLLMAGFWLSLARQKDIARAAEHGSTRDPIMERHASRTPATIRWIQCSLASFVRRPAFHKVQANHRGHPHMIAETHAPTLPERESDEMTWFIPPIVVPLFLVGLIAIRVASLSYF